MGCGGILFNSELDIKASNVAPEPFKSLTIFEHKPSVRETHTKEVQENVLFWVRGTP